MSERPVDEHDTTARLTPAQVMERIERAVGRLRGHAHVTPVMTSATLDARAGRSVWLKCEQFQRVGAFKFRGAFNAVSALTPAQRERGVLTYSSGNHAQAMALAGRLLGIKVTVVMPQNAPAAKLAATREYGANVITFDPRESTREDVAASLPEASRAVLIPPFDHYDVIAGQGTATCELLNQIDTAYATQPDVLLVPVGGAGLLAGAAVAARHLSPSTRVIGVEPEQADDAAQSLRAGRIVRRDNVDTIADGTRTPAVGERNFALIRELVADIVTVSERDIARAVHLLFERLKIVVEPSGALGVAALLAGRLPADQSAAVILSGGNVDVELFAQIIRGEFAG